jgi:hypothetical protein
VRILCQQEDSMICDVGDDGKCGEDAILHGGDESVHQSIETILTYV